MKRCSNSNCESSFLFGNDKTACPFCHGRLVENVAENDIRDQPILPPDRVVLEEDIDNNGAVEFVREHLGTMECHGRIVEIDHQELFNSKRHKLFNSLLRGEPYQFAHQTIEYTIRVENITDGYPTEITDFCLYGSYLGRLQVGDEVVVRAKNLNDRRVVKSIYNEMTASTVRPGLQLPAGFIRAALLLAAVIIVALICKIVWLFKSGAIAAGILAVIAALMPIIIICAGLWLLIKSVFPRRRR